MDDNWKKWIFGEILIGVNIKTINDILIKNNKKNDLSDYYVNFYYNTVNNHNIALNNYNEVESKLLANILEKKFRIIDELKNNNIIRIENFFDKPVADYILSTILKQNFVSLSKPLPNTKLTYSFNYSPIYTKELKNIFFLIKQLFSDYRCEISCAKYSKNDGIEEHTDEQGYTYKNNKYCRKYAIIFYFNKKWKKENGGALYDIENDIEYIPTFNSCVIFKVPHKHSVMPIKKGDRYSIFGWFAEPYNNQYHLPDNRFVQHDNLL